MSAPAHFPVISALRGPQHRSVVATAAPGSHARDHECHQAVTSDVRYPDWETLDRLQRGQSLAVLSDGARVTLGLAGVDVDPRQLQDQTMPSGSDLLPREPEGAG